MSMKQFLNFIGGEFFATGRTFENRAPVDNRVIGLVHEAGKVEVDAAVRAARAALTGDWGRMSASIAVVEHGFKSRYDASSALRRFGSGWRVGALDENKDIRLVVSETSFASRNLGRWRWLAGALVSSSTTRTDPLLSALRPAPLPIYSETRRDALNEAAVYGEAATAPYHPPSNEPPQFHV